jgi:plastocyanin domain-containing protein
MMTFAIGTAPGLLGIGGLTSVVRGIWAKRFFKFAGLLVLVFAIFNISNGFNLTGWQLISALAPTSNITAIDPNVRLENGVQVVAMTQGASGYSPNRFTIKKGIPVRWVINSEEPYSCAASIVVPKLGIRQKLEVGENIIEFNPTEAGTLKFSCSMGMYTGVFNVVDEKGGGATKAELRGVAKSGGICGVGSGGGCGGCGGGVKIKQDISNTVAQVQGDTQIIQSTYTANGYLQPNAFKVKVGQRVKFTIDVKDDGRGCGNAIMIPDLYNRAESLSAGQTITMDFTPTTPGNYDITCGMGMIRYGRIVVE